MLCSCEAVARSNYGLIDENERLARIITERHVSKKTGYLAPTAFALEDIINIGFSLVRFDVISAAEFNEVAEDIRRKSRSERVLAAVLWRAETIRGLQDDDKNRVICLFDDPVIGVHDTRDNDAHALVISNRSIDKIAAKEIRDALIGLFSRVESLADMYRAQPPGLAAGGPVAVF